MTNDEMLNKVRLDRPSLTIHRVKSFKQNNYGFYDVMVDLDTKVFDEIVTHTDLTIPYPAAEYNKLSEFEQCEYKFNNNKK